MPNITFMGAGSTVFAKNVLGDCMVTPALKGSKISLYDIDSHRLMESKSMLEAINNNVKAECEITPFLGVENRKAALKGADYVVNAIQVGGYEPCTVTDFEIPKKYGLKQTIADTLGIGGIFRALRTIPVMLDFAKDIEEVCPNAWLLNYSNPMAMLTGAMLRLTNVKTVGLCHSVQVCAEQLLAGLAMPYDEKTQWKIAGINHQAWLLEITQNGKDLYPEIKRRMDLKEQGKITPPDNIADMFSHYPKEMIPEMVEKAKKEFETGKHYDMVRYELTRRFGYYITESSEHNAEYTPYFIKNRYPELIDRFNVPLDEYPRRCVNQIEGWKKRRDELVSNPLLSHERTREYGSYIIEAMETNKPYKIGGNVLNAGLIDNLPDNAVVEVPCLVDASGILPCHIGRLPEQCAALNRTNINVQLLTIEAARTLKKEYIYQAALLDPHTSSELSIDDTIAMCDELITAHEGWIPKYN